jgi:hypothetical protein
VGLWVCDGFWGADGQVKTYSFFNVEKLKKPKILTGVVTF